MDDHARDNLGGPQALGTGRAAGDSVMGDAMVQMSVGGMHSHQCQERVVEAIAPLPGVREVEVDFNSGTVSVIYDPDRADPEAFPRKVTDAGYTLRGMNRLGG